MYRREGGQVLPSNSRRGVKYVVYMCLIMMLFSVVPAGCYLTHFHSLRYIASISVMCVVVAATDKPSLKRNIK